MQRFRKVLLIDEDPISTYIHTKLIERAGFAEETVCAPSGKQGCEILTRDCTSSGGSCPDLIFVNAHMQQMDGFEFLEEYSCLGIASPVKIILLSFGIDPREQKMIERFGEVSLLDRPLTAEALELIRKETFGPLP